MKRLLSTAILYLFLVIVSDAQNLVNGDLEGIITGSSQLPPSWLVVDFNDPNCVATSGGTTPDLTDVTGPNSSVGMMGTPYSGNTFLAGAHGLSTASGTMFQEGIRQTVSGFVIGENYNISLYQAVVKNIQSVDTSGSWMIIVDNTIIGVTDPTSSQEPYNSLSYTWENRILSFTATLSTHEVKFLPFDDDSSHYSSPTDLSGSLYMGIDLIEIMPGKPSAVDNHHQENLIKVYPNPFADRLSINFVNHDFQAAKLVVKNIMGQPVMDLGILQMNSGSSASVDLSSLSKGMYFLEFSMKNGVLLKKIVKY